MIMLRVRLSRMKASSVTSTPISKATVTQAGGNGEAALGEEANQPIKDDPVQNVAVGIPVGEMLGGFRVGAAGVPEFDIAAFAYGRVAHGGEDRRGHEHEGGADRKPGRQREPRNRPWHGHRS